MLVLAVPLLCSSCGSNHHVSPWGSSDRPQLSAFIERPDLDAQIARIDAETAPQNLRLVTEIRVDLPRRGGSAVLRGYEGDDTLGHPTHAVRVATGHGVVMALGPLDARDPLRDQAVELVPALVQAEGGDAPTRAGAGAGAGVGAGTGTGAFRSGTDLNGDGALDVVIRSPRRRLEIWRIALLGANPYEIAMAVPPTHALEIDGDGLIDLQGAAPIDPEDPIAPNLTDVATFDGARYTNATPSALAFHARLAAPKPPSPPVPSASASAPPPRGRPRDEARLAGALERAWHAVLSGKPREEALKELAREPVPPTLRAAFDRHTRQIAALAEPRRAAVRPAQKE
jgi:hypothetical protein